MLPNRFDWTRIGVGLGSLLTLFLLGACTSLPLPNAFVVPGSGSYMTHQRDAACAQRDTPDFDRARYPYPIVWTFQVNFAATISTSTGEVPLGCLHLYYADPADPAMPFGPIDSGGILVDSCRPVESGVLLNPTSGTATFDGSGGIVCELRLEEWVTSRGFEIDFTRTITQPGAIMALQNFGTGGTSTHYYNSFTIRAAITPTRMIDDSSTRIVPLARYEQHLPEIPPILFSIRTEDNQIATYNLAECPDPLACPSFGLDTPNVWWYDFLSNSGPSPHLNYAAAHTELTSGLIGEFLHPAPGEHIMLVDMGDGLVMPFWVGESMLYIGFDPATLQGLHGDMDEIILDPNNSKPTEG